MPPLPSLKAKEVVKIFEKLGWVQARRKGSHIVMKKEGHMATLSIPEHKQKDVAKGTLRNLIRAAGLTEAEFLAAR